MSGLRIKTIQWQIARVNLTIQQHPKTNAHKANKRQKRKKSSYLKPL